MTPEEFAGYLDRHGADLECWPANLRDAARADALTAAGRAELEKTRAFETMLEECLPAPPALGLKARILARLDTARPPLMAWWFGGARWRPMAAAVAPLALGFVLGFTWPTPDDSSEDAFEDAVSVLAFSPVFEDELMVPEGSPEGAGGVDEE